MNAHQDVHVRPDHPDFQHVRPFLTGDLAKEPAKEARQPGVDQGLALQGRPDEVAIEMMNHP